MFCSLVNVKDPDLLFILIKLSEMLKGEKKARTHLEESIIDVNKQFGDKSFNVKR